MNDLQKEILYKLRYQAFLSYNQLWNKQGDSSKFAYHLKELEKKGLVEKRELGYKLSVEGIRTIDYLTLKSPQPLIVVLIVAKKGDKVLVRHREKQPFKGYWEFCCSKIYQNETLEEAARERLKRKLGLEGMPIYKGVEFLQTKEQGEILMHHHLHVFLVEDPKGEPIEGEWVSIKPFGAKKPLPHLTQTLKIIQNTGFTIAFSDLIKEGEKYTSYITHSIKRFQ